MNQKLALLLEGYQGLLNVMEKVLATASLRRNLKEVIFSDILRERELVESRIYANTLTVTDIRSLSSDTLNYWNNAINLWTETFWKEVKKNSLPFIRKTPKPLDFALAKGRFRNLENSIDAQYNWSELLKSGILKDQYTERELDQIPKIIASDETRHVFFLKKCLIKRRIPVSKYLTFGASIAYLTHYKLLHNSSGNYTLLQRYFNKDEVAVLDEIWK